MFKNKLPTRRSLSHTFYSSMKIEGNKKMEKLKKKTFFWILAEMSIKWKKYGLITSHFDASQIYMIHSVDYTRNEVDD